MNLINTYGSDSELHVWSHDCAEQRRFLDERQQQLQSSNQMKQNSHQELALERQTFYCNKSMNIPGYYKKMISHQQTSERSSNRIVPSP